MVTDVYIDICTGEIVAFKYNNNGFDAIVTESKAKELDLEDSDILMYMTLNSILCLKYEDKVFLLESRCGDILSRFSTNNKMLSDLDYRMKLLENNPEYNYNGEYDEDSKKVLLFGYLFDKYSGVSINNETAIRRFLNGSEEYM